MKEGKIMKCVNGECVRLEKEICCFDCDKLYDCKKEDAACNNYDIMAK